MTDQYALDGAGYRYQELPKLNLELITECLRWVEHNTEETESPLWFQGTWNTTINKDNRDVQYQFQGTARENYCGTAFCVAGYAVHASGFSMNMSSLAKAGLLDKFDYPLAYEDPETAIYRFTEMTDPGMVGHDGELVAPNATRWGEIDWETAGQRLLGLTPTETARLFAGNNGASYIRALILAIVKSRGLELK